MTGHVTLSEQPPFVTLSEVEWVCHVERPAGVETSRFFTFVRNDTICHVERPTGVETSTHFNYQLAIMFSSFPKSFQVGLSVSIRAFFFALDQPFNCFSLLIA